MTQDEIIRMAREAGLYKILDEHAHEYGNGTAENTEYPELERFAAIVAENTGIEQQREIVRLKGIIEEQANGAQNLVLEEREECAKVCAMMEWNGRSDEAIWKGDAADECAAAIRARGEK